MHVVGRRTERRRDACRVLGEAGMSDRVVLGVNCSHDAAACVAVDGRIVSAVSEERLNRLKHCFGWPRHSVDYVMSELKQQCGVDQPDSIVINELPSYDNEHFAVRRFPCLDRRDIIVNPSHHLLHAYYAMIFARMRPMVILVVDGSGYSYAEHRRRNSPLLGPEPAHHDAWESLSAYYVDTDNTLSLITKQWGVWKEFPLRFPSLGHMYSVAAHHIFGSWTHAGKVMGLAPYGHAGNGFKKIVTLTDEGADVDTDWILDVPRLGDVTRLEEDVTARNLAAHVQTELELALRHITNQLYAKTGCRSICLCGGVALNSVFNGQLMREGPFDNVLITPAAHDAGTAIGAAAYGYQRLTGRLPTFAADAEFLGRTYSDADILSALARRDDVCAQRIDDPARAAAEELAAGRTIGWFEGPSEFGPRALGHRSILADPRGPGVRDELNGRIKFREMFRPYAAAVLREECSAWFEDDFDSPYMLAVSRVKPHLAARIPAVVHVDGSCRLQTVEPDYPGRLRAVLEHFYRLTGVPLVLNTSLNVHGEPMSETPEDAFDCVTRSGLDCVYVGGYRAERQIKTIALDDRLVTTSARDFTLISEFRKREDRFVVARSWIQQGPRRVELTSTDREIVLACLDRKSIKELSAMVPATESTGIVTLVERLRNHGLLSVYASDADDRTSADIPSGN